MTRKPLTDATLVVRSHRYVMPTVREIDPPQPRRVSSQRALVEASLLRCPDKTRPTHRLWP